MRKNQNGNIMLLILLIGVIVGSMMLAFGLPGQYDKTAPTVNLIDKPTYTKSDSIHLDTLVTGTATPSTSNTCPIDTTKPIQNSPGCTCTAYLMRCVSRACTEVLDNPNASEAYRLNPQVPMNQRCTTYFGDSHCPTFDTNNIDGIYCLSKPIIYLYPREDTFVSVRIATPGTIYMSIPTYPSTTGWENILAHPNGSLEYQKQTYSELYYESAVKHILTPQNGIIIPTNSLASSLSRIVTQLGLLPRERDEFIAYWMPKLTQLHANFILFSLLTQEAKDNIDHVDITPKPETFIQFMAYFKPLDFPIAVEPLTLSPSLQRNGFTAVEWGGTIDMQ